jgi:hypothetical protein
MDVDFCLEVLCEAVGTAGTVPEIINTDQGVAAGYSAHEN